jgi:hypothetical protein
MPQTQAKTSSSIRQLTPAPRAGKYRSDGNLSLFDERPIQLPGFCLRARKAEPIGRPTKEQWQVAFELAEAAEESSPYWVGDLALYADTRADWAEQLSQIVAPQKMARHTIENLKSISKRVGPRARALAPSRSHASEVAAMPAPDQERWLQRATDENWTQRELARAIKASQRETVLDGRARSMFTVDVTVQVEIEAGNKTMAEDLAWEDVKHSLRDEKHAKVVAARAQPR